MFDQISRHFDIVKFDVLYFTYAQRGRRCWSTWGASLCCIIIISIGRFTQYRLAPMESKPYKLMYAGKKDCFWVVNMLKCSCKIYNLYSWLNTFRDSVILILLDCSFTSESRLWLEPTLFVVNMFYVLCLCPFTGSLPWQKETRFFFFTHLEEQKNSILSCYSERSMVLMMK